MRKKVIFVVLIWIVLATIVFVLYWIREASPVKEFITWALNVWPILVVIGAGAIALSGWIIKHGEIKGLKDIKSDIINMNGIEKETSIKKSRQRCPAKIARQIHDDVIAIFPMSRLLSIIQNAEGNDFDPLLDFFKKFSDILDANEWGLKTELENIESYKSSRLDLAQKRIELHTTKRKGDIIQDHINWLCKFTYGFNSIIILRGIIRSLPKTSVTRIVLSVLEGVEAIGEEILAYGLNNLENEWDMKFDPTKIDVPQLQAMINAMSNLRGKPPTKQ